MTQRSVKRVEALEAAAVSDRDRLIVFLRTIGTGDSNRKPIGVDASAHLPAVDVKEGETDDEFFARVRHMAAHLPASLSLILRFRYAPDVVPTDEEASHAAH